MNGFTDKGLDESNFGGPGGDDSTGPLNAVKAFDAFPKTKANYTERTSSGGVWTVLLVVASLALTFSELSRWWVGETRHTFAVEQGVGHDLQINLDVVVAMQCDDLHINVQDSSGDRILAGEKLKKDPTMWKIWGENKKNGNLGTTMEERLKREPGSGGQYKVEDVHDHLGPVRTSSYFKSTPRVPRRMKPDSCRIFGSLHGNKVQGDFHITARGHGYMELAEHLSHDAFNFSHQINELSFGPYYPSLTNPLDDTIAVTEAHFQKFQYYLSVVPTIYTTDVDALRKIDKYHESPSSGEDGLNVYPYRNIRNTVFTNQYAVTEQSRELPEHNALIPGVFIKFDIEPILLMISEEWSSLPALFIRIVNVVSGVLVAGGWCYQISEWARDYRRSARQRSGSMGYLNGGFNEKR